MSEIVIAALPAQRDLAARIRDLLAGTFPDVSLLPDDAGHAEQTVAGAGLLLVLAGDAWHEVVADDAPLLGAVRAGLVRSDLPLIVTTLDGYAMPPVTDLPEPVRAIAYMTQEPLRTDDAHFSRDMRRLAGEIQSVLKHAQVSGATGEGVHAKPTPRRGVPFNVWMLLVILAIAAFILLVPREDIPLPGTAAEDTTDDTPDDAPAPDLLIGVAGGFTGSTAARGETMLNGVDLALRDRPSVTVAGETFLVDRLAQDAGCSATRGGRVAEVFAASPNLAGVIGHMCNTSCAAAAPIYDAAGLPAISPSCDAPGLTEASATFSRVVAPRTAIATAAANTIYDTLVTDGVAVIRDEQPIAPPLVDAFVAQFEARGGTISGVYTGETGTLDHALTVETALANGATAVYFTGRTSNAALIRRQLVEQGAGDLPFIIAIPDDMGAYIEQAGDLAEGTITFATQAPDSAEFSDLSTRYVTEFDGDPESAIFAYAYDATNALLDAVEATGAIAEDGTLIVDHAALLDAIHAYTAEGITGALACDPGGECAAAQTAAFVVQSGEMQALTSGE